MRTYESVLGIAGVSKKLTNINTNIPFIISHLGNLFEKPCRILVQITYPDYSRAQITELFVFSYVGYQRFA